MPLGVVCPVADETNPAMSMVLATVVVIAGIVAVEPLPALLLVGVPSMASVLPAPGVRISAPLPRTVVPLLLAVHDAPSDPSRTRVKIATV